MMTVSPLSGVVRIHVLLAGLLGVHVDALAQRAGLVSVPALAVMMQASPFRDDV
jgi:hypothetical protein